MKMLCKLETAIIHFLQSRQALDFSKYSVLHCGSNLYDLLNYFKLKLVSTF